MTQQYLLKKHLPQEKRPSDDDILNHFLSYLSEKKLDLYNHQEEAILSLYSGNNVILNTPTGSGKSLVATALQFRSLALDGKSVYTCPIKALVNEKFLSLAREFGPENVGLITGDASVNPRAPILCCTAEILANICLREGETSLYTDVIMDEFHYYGDRDRGVAWQIPLLTLNYSRFLLMSATLGDTSFFEDDLTKRTGRKTITVKTAERPVPLNFEYKEIPLHETLRELAIHSRFPIYLVNFAQRDAADQAQSLLSEDFASKEEKKKIAEELSGFKFSSPYGKEFQRFIRHGIGIHHAGLLPKYRILVEKLAQQGLLKVISGTDTLGVGINVPIKTVLFSKLCKFDGQKTMILSVRDFHQIAGRAGRKGYDTEGFVLIQAPEHVIENLSQEKKAAGDPKKLKKIVKKKPPEKGFVPWTQDTFKKLIDSTPEKLESRFIISPAMILHTLSRGRSGWNLLKILLKTNHDTPAQRSHHRRQAFQMIKNMRDRKIIELFRDARNQLDIRLNIVLQQDFSMFQSLSLYLFDAMAQLDQQDPLYCLNALSLVEACVEDPELILRRQLDKVKGLKLLELKAAGMEYDERMEELEKCEYPKPNAEFIYNSFNLYKQSHPQIMNGYSEVNVSPKSIARDMFETFRSFEEYIKDYDLQRSEGLLLRYLTDVYKTLQQSVPEYYKTAELYDVIRYFDFIIRRIDASLIEEWEKLKSLGSKKSEGIDATSPEEEFNEHEFTVKIRNTVFLFLRHLSNDMFEEALSLLGTSEKEDAPKWSVDTLKARKEEYISGEWRQILTDRNARNPINTKILKHDNHWTIEQTILDDKDFNDWHVVFECIIDKNSNKAAVPSLTLLAIEAIG